MILPDRLIGLQSFPLQKGINMELYHVQFVDYEGVAIFAENLEKAEHLVNIFLTFNFAKDTYFNLSKPVGLQYLSKLEHCQLQAALELTVQGCGVYNRQTGWQIVRPWQYPLMRKPDYKYDEVVSA